MSFSAIKKFFRKKKPVNIGDELKRSLMKDLEIFKHVPSETVGRIDDVKSTLTAILLLSVHDRSWLDYQLFDQKLKSLVEYFKQNVLVREYVNRVYSKDQQVHYNIVVNELFQTCELLSSQLRNMLYFKDRNSRIAEMTIDIAQSSKQLKEKRHESRDDIEASTGDWSSEKSAATRSFVQNGVQRRHGLQRRFRRFRDRVTAVQLFATGRRRRRRHHLKGHTRCRRLGHDRRKQLSRDISSRRD